MSSRQREARENHENIFTWNNMQKDIKLLCKYCHVCQMNKKTNKNKYGKLPEKLVETRKWKQVNIDCWGPKTD